LHVSLQDINPFSLYGVRDCVNSAPEHLNIVTYNYNSYVNYLSK